MQVFFPALLCAACCVAGCAGTPAARHYTLAAEARASHPVTADKRKIEIVSVRIPETWDRPQIVLTKSAGEIGISEFHRWAAPLRAEVPRIVTQNLARLLDTSTLWLRRDFAGTQPDLRVQVVIEQIEALPGEALKLEAAWMIHASHGIELRGGRSSVSVPLAERTHEAVVAATNRALLALSIDLARDLRAVPL